MPDIKLYDYQKTAVSKMHDGCILCGGVGSGKSRTALAYYFTEMGGQLDPYKKMPGRPKDLYIITTAKKRDSYEWEEELSWFLLSTKPELNVAYRNKVIVDSWNNIKKYECVEDSFFIFDEQRVVGYGVWSKTFIDLTKKNRWVLLSATPGDKWEDYIPVFIANGFYKNKTEFSREHLVYSRYSKYPKVDRYIGLRRLERLRERVLVDMDFKRETTAHHEDVWCEYDRPTCRLIRSKRWDIYENKPIKQISKMCYLLRQVVNSDPSRALAVLELFEKHPKMIIFYNFDYELDILKGLCYGKDVEIAEWNGHRHQPVPESSSWVYLVQYTAGAEGWNCITTDTIVFFSQSYSWRSLEQACGRINRLNTPYTDLYYYHLKSRADIDMAIARALRNKKNFNERKFDKSFVD